MNQKVKNMKRFSENFQPHKNPFAMQTIFSFVVNFFFKALHASPAKIYLWKELGYTGIVWGKRTYFRRHVKFYDKSR